MSFRIEETLYIKPEHLLDFREYLSKNLSHLKKNVISGFNITCIGDEREYSFLPSRNGNTISDKIAQHVLKNIDPKYSFLFIK